MLGNGLRRRRFYCGLLRRCEGVGGVGVEAEVLKSGRGTKRLQQ